MALQTVDEKAYEQFIARAFNKAGGEAYRLAYHADHTPRRDVVVVKRTEQGIVGEDASGQAITRDLGQGRVIAMHIVVHPKRPLSVRASQHTYKVERSN